MTLAAGLSGAAADADIVGRLPAILDAVRILSPSRESAIHGEEHWRRVATLTLDITAKSGGDRVLGVLFGMFHDCLRFNDDRDPDHGKRGGFLVACLNTELLGLSDERLDLLDMACRDHTLGQITDDPTIGACWDADRLDLVRLGHPVDESYLSTETARSTWMLRRARTLIPSPPAWVQIFRALAEQP